MSSARFAIPHRRGAAARGPTSRASWLSRGCIYGLWLPLAFVAFAPAPRASAQSASIGADIVSRYVWRGFDFGESLSVQPALTFGFGGLEVGAWGSYSVSASGAGANENDLWAAYTIETSNGTSLSVGVTDYYFPAPDAEYRFQVNKAHTTELSLSVTGPEGFPISLMAGMMFRNDPDNSVYLEAGIPLTGDVGLVAGMVTGASGFYGTDGGGIVNLGVSASNALEITDSFALPLSVSYILNPHQGRAFLVFGMSLAP